MSTSSLRDGAAALGRAVTAIDAAEWHQAEAVGIGVDSTEDIRGICVVYDNAIVFEAYAAGLDLLPQDQFDDIVRVCRFIAWSSWRAQHSGVVIAA